MSADRRGRSNPRRKVGIAEYAVVTDGTALVTSGLGSCLAIVLYDPTGPVSGLVHVMLPAATDGRDANPAKFVDTGLPLLVDEMEAAGASRASMHAWVVGGSEMLEYTIAAESIGRRNVAAARETLAELGLPIVATDVGGRHGRSVEFDPTSGSLEVRTADRPARTL